MFRFDLFENSDSIFNDFLAENLLTLLVALLAINPGTTGIVLTKVRELVEKYGHAEIFTPTRNQMLLAVQAKIELIFFDIPTHPRTFKLGDEYSRTDTNAHSGTGQWGAYLLFNDSLMTQQKVC